LLLVNTIQFSGYFTRTMKLQLYGFTLCPSATYMGLIVLNPYDSRESVSAVYRVAFSLEIRINQKQT